MLLFLERAFARGFFGDRGGGRRREEVWAAVALLERLRFFVGGGLAAGGAATASSSSVPASLVSCSLEVSYCCTMACRRLLLVLGVEEDVPLGA